MWLGVFGQFPPSSDADNVYAGEIHLLIMQSRVGMVFLYRDIKCFHHTNNFTSPSYYESASGSIMAN